MRRLLSVVLVGIMVTALLVGCKATPKEPKGTLLGEGNNSVKVGEKLKIKLAENITTGFSWAYTISDENGIVFDEEFIKEDNKGVPGAGSQKTWIFEAKTAGTYTIEYKYSQSFDKETEPEQDIVYTVEVK